MIADDTDDDEAYRAGIQPVPAGFRIAYRPLFIDGLALARDRRFPLAQRIALMVGLFLGLFLASMVLDLLFLSFKLLDSSSFLLLLAFLAIVGIVCVVYSSRSRKTREEVVLTLGKDALVYTRGRKYRRVPWEDIARWVRSRYYVTLFTKDRAGFVIPIRAVREEEWPRMIAFIEAATPGAETERRVRR